MSPDMDYADEKDFHIYNGPDNLSLFSFAYDVRYFMSLYPT